METHHDYILRLRELARERDGVGLTAWEIDRLDQWAEEAERQGDSFHLTERRHEICADIEGRLS